MLAIFLKNSASSVIHFSESLIQIIILAISDTSLHALHTVYYITNLFNADVIHVAIEPFDL